MSDVPTKLNRCSICNDTIPKSALHMQYGKQVCGNCIIPDTPHITLWLGDTIEASVRLGRFSAYMRMENADE